MTTRRLTWPAILITLAAFWTYAALEPLQVLAAVVVLASLRIVEVSA